MSHPSLQRGFASRRTVLSAGGVALLGVGAAATLPLFSSPDRRQDPAKCFAEDKSKTSRNFNVSNWPLYMDEDDDGYVSTLTDFQQTFDVNVDYHIDVTDNIVFFNKVVNQLGSCASTGRDMMMLTDWMAARMIQMGWIQPIRAERVPNLHANLISSLKAPGWDPNREFSAPWQAGFTGIAYNKKYLKDPPTTMKDLFTRESLRGKVSCLTEMRDTMGLVMLGLGIDPADFTDTEWTQAIDYIDQAKKSGHIRAFSGNEYVDDLSAGNVFACTAWSGDIAASEDPNLGFLVPDDGMMIWADNMLVPNLSEHISIAEDWINFYYEPANAAKLAYYNFYVSPVQGIRPYMEEIDPTVLEDPNLSNLILPDDAYLAKTHGFMALSESKIRNYERDFSRVSGV